MTRDMGHSARYIGTLCAGMVGTPRVPAVSPLSPGRRLNASDHRGFEAYPVQLHADRERPSITDLVARAGAGTT